MSEVAVSFESGECVGPEPPPFDLPRERHSYGVDLTRIHAGERTAHHCLQAIAIAARDRPRHAERVSQ